MMVSYQEVLKDRKLLDNVVIHKERGDCREVITILL
jgi:hypothetical protein